LEISLSKGEKALRY